VILGDIQLDFNSQVWKPVGSNNQKGGPKTPQF